MATNPEEAKQRALAKARERNRQRSARVRWIWQTDAMKQAKEALRKAAPSYSRTQETSDAFVQGWIAGAFSQHWALNGPQQVLQMSEQEASGFELD